jgi:hypothetical protein
LKSCLPTASGCHFYWERRLRNVAVFWAAPSQANQLDRASTYHSGWVTPSEFASSQPAAPTECRVAIGEGRPVARVKRGHLRSSQTAGNASGHFPQHRELLACFLGATLSLDPIRGSCPSRSTASCWRAAQSTAAEHRDIPTGLPHNHARMAGLASRRPRPMPSLIQARGRHTRQPINKRTTFQPTRKPLTQISDIRRRRRSFLTSMRPMIRCTTSRNWRFASNQVP